MAESRVPEPPHPPKKRTRESPAEDADDEAPVEEAPSRLLKRIVLALSQPTTLLGTGAVNPRCFHRAKLVKLLRKLVLRHQWSDAAGVLAVLLGGGASKTSPAHNRLMYSVLMEIGERLSESKEVWIKNTFEAWERKNLKLEAKLVEYKRAVVIERLSLMLAQGNLIEAEAMAFTLRQRVDFQADPLQNMIVGLTFLQLWFSKLPKEMQWRGADQFYTTESNELYAGSEGHGSINSNEAGSAAHCDSETSVMIHKVCNELSTVACDADSGLHREISVEVDDMEVENSPQNFEMKSFEAGSAENSEEEASSSDYGGQLHVSELEGLESLLLPIRMQEPHGNHGHIFNDHYKYAEKHLRHALHLAQKVATTEKVTATEKVTNTENDTNTEKDTTKEKDTSKEKDTNTENDTTKKKDTTTDKDTNTEKHTTTEKNTSIFPLCWTAAMTPPVLVALHPLIQLLLIGGKYEDARNEIERFLKFSDAVQLTRLKASLLKQFDCNNKPELSTCLENILKKDPTCCGSLETLVLLHQNDNYSSESLLEMIALHLDATNAEYNVWREYAMCFLKLSQYEEDRMSVCSNESEGGHKPRYSVSFSKTPKILIQGQAGKNWKLRCRWWSRVHFSDDVLAAEIEAGELELVTYKAASAVHMYGPEFCYVLDARCCLEKENKRDLLSFLQLHILNSVRIYPNFHESAH